MISTTALRYFLEVARRGSMKSAAEHLHIAASAVSRQIMLLEDDLHAPVFERRAGRAKLKLTAAGEALLQYAKANENEVQRLRSSVEALKGLQAGSIRFGISETFATHFFPNFLKEFNQKHPRIAFRVEVAHINTLTKMLVDDELDAMMGYNPLEVVDVEMVFDKLIPTYIIVAPNHPLASRPSVSLSDCVGYGVGLLDATSPMKQVYDTMFSRAKLRPQQLISSNSYSLLRNVAAAGMCFSFVNEHMSNPPQANGNYCYVPVRDNRVKPARFVVCVRRGRNLPVAATAFIDRLIEALPAARTE